MACQATIMSRAFGLPRDFPEGTRFVVEGCPDIDGHTRIVSRYLVFPDGRRVDLPSPAAGTRLAPVRNRRAGRGRARSLKSARARPFLLV